MSNDNGRYGNNANLWRKTYGYVRRKPASTVFFDEKLSITRSFDLNTTYRHRDYFEVDGFNHDGDNPQWLIPIVNYLEYEEALIYFDNETEKTVNFSTAFNLPPFVVYMSVPNSDNTHNINVFGTALPTTTQMFIGTSAPFTGYIHYIAAASSFWAQPSTSGSSTHIWAGEINLNGENVYTASYGLPSGGSDYVYYDTIHEISNSFSANTNTENDSKDETTSTNSLSTGVNNKIHFIIFRIT